MENSIDEYQKLYRELISLAASVEKVTYNRMLLNMSMRSSVINKYDRVTGDSITTIINLIMEKLDTLGPNKLYELLHNFSEYQKLVPEDITASDSKTKENRPKSRLMKGFLQVVREYREGL